MRTSGIRLSLALLAACLTLTACSSGSDPVPAAAPPPPPPGGGTPPPTSSVTLTWLPPTEKTDGTPLNDLWGYKIYWGQSQTSYPNIDTVSNPGISSYVVDQLGQGTWYFVVTAVDSGGVESEFSNVASKTL